MKASIEVSDDGKNWLTISTFEYHLDKYLLINPPLYGDIVKDYKYTRLGFDTSDFYQKLDKALELIKEYEKIQHRGAGSTDITLWMKRVYTYLKDLIGKEVDVK